MMSTKNLKWIAIILPIFFLGAVLTVRTRFGTVQGAWVVEIILFVLIVIGIVAFSTWIFGVISQREYEIRARTEQLRALHEAALALTTELDLSSVLQKVVDLARELANARYGALGVLGESGAIEQFITSGLDTSTRENIGSPPHGRGILGAISDGGQSLLVKNIPEDPRSVGFPKNHPQMTTLMGVPIRSKGQIIGNLYLVDKLPGSGDERKQLEFNHRDQQILEMFATQAAIAIENAQLYRQTQQLAVLQERERFGMDLHDGIIQSIYAIGLMLETTQHQIETIAPDAEKGISHAIHGLNDVIRDIRNYILDLRPQRFQGRDLQAGIEELARDLRANSFLEVQFSANGFDQSGISPENTVEILHVVQEALANIRKHARATAVKIALDRDRDALFVTVEDNGAGMDLEKASQSLGNGLHNMRERTRNLDGRIDFRSSPETGTKIVLRIPEKV